MPRVKVNIVAKLWAAFVVLILVVMVPLELALDHLLTDFYANQVTEPLLFHATQLADMLSMDPTSLSVAPMMGRMVGGDVIVVDAGGKPITFAGSSTVEPPKGAVDAALAGHTYTGQSNGYIVSAAPVAHQGGAVLLLAPQQPVIRSLTTARRYLRLATFGTLAAATILALLISRSLMRPLLAIEHATGAIAQGDFSTRVKVTTSDEIGRLAGAVNAMTAQLESFEKRRRAFLANVAHELRTPLSYIRGYTQAIAAGLVPAQEDRERYGRIVYEESVRLGRLVDDLMDMAQIDEGQLAMDRVPLDLRVPVEQAAATVRPQAEAKGVTLRVELAAGLPQPLADGGRIQQVVFNLLDNGLRYTPEGGTLTVSAVAEGRWVTVRVRDTGPGIDPEALPLIFERFERRHSSGRGLGLAIVRSIVKAHGGEVGVENRPGEGATFWFRLPLPE